MNRTQAEDILIRRLGALLTAVDLDGTTVGQNPDLNDPLRYALRRLGYTIANVSAISDADVSGVSSDDEDALLDIAELRVLESAQNQAGILVDISIGDRRESLSQLASSLQKRVEAKSKQVLDNYGGAVGAGLEAGSFQLDFQEDGSNIY